MLMNLMGNSLKVGVVRLPYYSSDSTCFSPSSPRLDLCISP